MDKIRIRSDGIFITPSNKDGYIFITGDNLEVEEFRDGEWKKVETKKTERDRRIEKIVAKRRMVQGLIEDRLPEGITIKMAQEYIREGIEAQEEEFKEMGKDAFFC